MKSTRITLIPFLIIFFITGTGYAKDLRGRLGIGFNSQLTERGVNSISTKYWLSSNLGFQGTFGFVSSDDYDELDLGGKVLFKIQDEKNLHVDTFGGLGFVSYDPEVGDSDSGLAISGGLAIEYFFSGLPNLGFSSEIGMQFSDINDNSSFRTTADTFITAGIHYYFKFTAPSNNKPGAIKKDDKKDVNN